MAATMRFGIPAADDAEQTILGTRWGDDPSGSAAAGFFPFAVAITSTAYTATMRNMTGTGTESVDPDGSGIAKMLFHPESGLLSNGITDIAFFNDGAAANTIFASWPGRVRMIAGLESAFDTEWFALGSVPSDNFATLDAIVAPAVATYAANADVYGYVLGDDVTAYEGVDDPVDDLADQAMARVAALDAAHRPASPSLLGSNYLPPTVDPGDAIVLGSGTYPCRWISTGVKRVDGDFTVNSITYDDWQEVIRAHVEAFPDSRVWWWCQAHKLGDGSTPTAHLAYPAAPEIRKQVWEAIGAGAKGLLWFIYQDNPDAGAEWEGLAHPNSRARLQALAEMNQRIDPSIRARLLRAAPYTDLFTATGGGSNAAWLYANYANAYVGTLRDAASGTFYCVVCNRRTGTQSVTLDSAIVDGDLVNLETGATVALGGSVSLPALDGAIYRFVGSDSYGVPHAMPNASLTTEQWWDASWFNPLGANYVPPGDIATHPNIVNVGASDDLQAAIDAAPDNTTFRLAANGGPYGEITLVGRNGIHIVAADPFSPPTMRGLSYFGHAAAQTDYQAFVDAVVNDNTPSAIAAYLDPPGDILVRDVDFVQETDLLSFEDTAHHYPEHVPFLFICAADVCIERCTFTGYRYVDQNGLDIGNPDHHHGIVTGTGGAHNIVMRNCTLNIPLRANLAKAWSCAVYFDGAAGCGFVNNDLPGEEMNVGLALFLTNDDYAPKTATVYDGVAGYDPINGEIPHARYNAVYGTTSGYNAFYVEYGGRNLLMAENSASLDAAVARVCAIDARLPSHSVGLTGQYAQLNSVIRDNTYTNGSITSEFVQHRFDTGEFAGGSTVGLTTITGNVVSGTVAKWYQTSGTGTAETPITATNNSAAGVPRDGV